MDDAESLPVPDVNLVLPSGTVVPHFSFLLRVGSSVLRHALDASPVAEGTVVRIALPLAVSDLAAELALDRLKPDYLRAFPGGHFCGTAGSTGSWSTATSPPPRGGPTSYLGASSPSPARAGSSMAEERVVPCAWNPFVPLCREYIQALEYLSFTGLRQLALGLNVTNDWGTERLDTSPGNLNESLCMMSRLSQLLTPTESSRLFQSFERELLTEGGHLNGGGGSENNLLLSLGPPFSTRGSSVGLLVWRQYAQLYTEGGDELSREAKQLLDSIVASSVCRSHKLATWLKAAS